MICSVAAALGAVVAVAAQAPAAPTLIAPDWVLTTARTAEDVSPLSGRVEIGGRKRPVRRVLLADLSGSE